MLKVKIADRFVDLGKTSVSFELLNPIFNDIGSFSYPFTFPNTPGNREKLNFPDRLHNAANVSKSHECEIYIAGMIWKRGRLIIREANDREIKANFAVGEGSYFNLIKDIKLHEVNLGSYVAGNPELNWFNDIWSNKYPNAPFALFHHKNEHLTAEADIPAYLEAGLPYFTEFNRFHPVTYSFIPMNTFMPFVYLNYVLDKINESIEINERDNDLKNDEELKQIVFANNTSASDLVIQNNHFRIFNIAINRHVPKMTAGELLKNLETTFGLFTFYNEDNKEVSFKLFKSILEQPSTIINSAFKLNQLSPPENNDGFILEINNDLICELNKSIDISNYDYKGSVATFSELPGNAKIDDLYFVDELLAFYRLADQYGNWSQVSDFPYSIFRKYPGKKVVEYMASMLHNEAAIKGNGFFSGLTYNELPCAFLFYRGFVNSKSSIGGTDFYFQPLGTAYDQHPDFSGTFNYSMLWAGTNGLYEKLHKDVLNFHAATRPAEYTMPLTPAQLKQIDFSKKYRWDQADWLIDRIRFTVTNDRITPATVTALKVQQ